MTIPSLEPSSHPESTEIIDPTEHVEIENHEAITTPDVNPSQDSSETGHDELQETPEAPGEEHEGSYTPEPTDNHERENESTDIPEQHATPEPTEEH